MVSTLDDGESEPRVLEPEDDEELDDVIIERAEVEIDVEIDVEVDIEVELGPVGVGVEEASAEDEADEPTGNTTTLAELPLGMVTTQKLAPPAPEASSELVTPPIPSVEGSIEHGRPLQPEPAH